MQSRKTSTVAPQGRGLDLPSGGTRNLTCRAAGINRRQVFPLSRTLTVTDRPPNLNTYYDATVTVRVGGTFEDPAAEDIWCYDITDGDLSSSVTATGAVDTSNPGTYVVTYTCTDGYDHTDSDSITVVVKAGG